MKTIEYRAVYTGKILGKREVDDRSPEDIIRVQARDINSGYVKALKIARQPLGSGRVREILRVEFWQVL